MPDSTTPGKTMKAVEIAECDHTAAQVFGEPVMGKNAFHGGGL